MASRREKYPDTDTFKFYNANPNGRITTDCIVRAISTAMELPYNTVVLELAQMQIKTGYDCGDVKCYGAYIESMGWRKCKQPRKDSGRKYTGYEFCRTFRADAERCIAHLGGNHVAAIVGGQVHDTWDSTSGCVGNYWIK